VRDLRVTCRLCEAEETFQFAENIEASDWTEIAPMFVYTDDGYRESRGYCPGHSLEDT